MIKAIKRWYHDITLYFTDREYYEQRRRYLALQKAARRKLKKLADDFCPWSGYYMHEMIRCMLEFYAITYKNGDCCWSETDRRLRIAKELDTALVYASRLDAIEEVESDKELLVLAQKEPEFEAWVENWTKQFEDCEVSERLLPGLAYSYFEEKYTRLMYETIGKYIWGWCD